ncbi:short-chain-enoyl-CoA hydratase [Clostridium tetani]|uniref:short-chain-enoyl-CoA hydratase n=1 Tax=Clostridium tetani TaxID=1513 RepID=UPI000D20E46F|nr:short-chain-enoyl-CoA hydratase [Clostridium tetani]AVP55389.1 crotonase [Clostridium tetani]RXI77275.1 crotonase [Clostridium tetani]WFN62319.1 short-chain-enoyl-CoA hydratase [Clostridium tetani]SUY54501.1 3-hydroxybutyryl-CoA dehydratase [Clostridium tetani]BDR66083.1 short-chain-enoyl-CoA hydratase [Clostridium tetani]
MKNIILKKENGIAEITINRPKSLNALNSETLNELKVAIKDISESDDVKVLIITGAGEKAFVAGADITEMQNLNAKQGRALARLAQKVFSDIEHMPQIVIAAINGYALGGGCELCMACDIRLASKNAKFGQPEVNLGITPGFAGTQRLPRLVGKGTAKELIFTTDMIDANEAYRIQLVNKVYEADELIGKARELAKKIMSKAPYAVSLAKAAINDGMNMDTESAYKYEADIFGLCFATEDQKEGMKAFLEKRKSNFKGC